MDELELLKNNWQKDVVEYPKLSAKDIYPMLVKKSSSIVKWLFYISIGEFLLWVILNSIPFVSSDEYRADLIAAYGSESKLIAITIFSYVIILLFIYLLYKSYRSISVTDNTKQLIGSILKTRKIVKYYVIYNLIMAFLAMVFSLRHVLYNKPGISEKFADFSDKQLFVAYLFMTFCVGIFVLIIWLFYKLIYGILLKRLNQNYKELKKLEV